jgi:hypothetical protein
MAGTLPYRDTMKKYIPFFFILLLFSVGWSPGDLFPVYKNLKTDIVAQLNELFGREVSVESVSGTLVNQVELNNVSIAKGKRLSDGSIIKAKKIVLHYSPVKLAATGGNIISALSKIELIDPIVIVERDKQDRWNVFSLIPMSKPKKKNEKEKPLNITANIIISNASGEYIDYLGWGEDLKGIPFISKFKDFNAEIKINGPKITISKVKGTSIVKNSVAYANVTGNLNTKTGKYLFIVRATDVDIEQWGYYTMNIPNFKARTGKSDMTLTMTNPPPRKKGMPILFDGKFNIKNGKADIFGMEFTAMNGFVRVLDEEVTLKNMKGSSKGITANANGRLWDFSVANYDIGLSLPDMNEKALKEVIPQISSLPWTGNAGAAIQIGGNYGAPTFAAKVSVKGEILSRKIDGIADMSYEGSVIRITSSRLRALDSDMSLSGIVDFAANPANIVARISGEAIALTELFQMPIPGKGDLGLTINGNANDLSAALHISGESGADISAAGKYADKTFNISALLKNCTLADQHIDEARARMNILNGNINFPSIEIKISEHSSISASGTLNKTGGTNFDITAISLEAEELTGLKAYLPDEISQLSGKLDLYLSLKDQATEESFAKMREPEVSGKISLVSGYISNERIKSLTASLNWNRHRLIITNSRIQGDKTDAIFSGTFEADSAYRLSISGMLDLANLKPLTMKYGRFFGVGPVYANIHGKGPNIGFMGDFAISDFRYNDIVLNDISGSVDYDGKTFSLVNPLNITINDDNYIISGKVTLAKKPAIQLKIDVPKGSLDTLSEMIGKINSEIATKQLFASIDPKKKMQLFPAMFRFPLKKPQFLYRAEGDKSHLDEMKMADSAIAEFRMNTKEDEKQKLSGKFSGSMSLIGDLSSPSGEVAFKAGAGSWESYSFDEAGINLTLKGGTFEARSIYIKKNDGVTNVRGYFNPDRTSSIEISAVNMPVDFLTLFMPEDKEMKGVFFMDASISGRSPSLSGSMNISADKISIGGIPMDKVEADIGYMNNTLFFRKLEILSGKDIATVLGKLPMANNIPISLRISMEGATLGLLTLPIDNISWIGGRGRGYLGVSGTASHPVMNGSLSLANAAIYIKGMDSNLQEMNSSISIINNSASTGSLKAKWVGTWTGRQMNSLNMSGKIDWDKLYSLERTIEVSLKMDDSSFNVDIPSFYTGDIDIKNFKLKGVYGASKEAGIAPILSGGVSLENGVFTLPDMSKSSKLPPLGLDIKLDIKKNTYIVAGDTKNLISTDFSNLLLNLEVAGENISLAGEISALSITGKASFGRGTVNILNREFSLMTEDRQKTVFGSSLDKIKLNEAVFSGGNLPYINLSAEIKVKNTEKLSEATATEPAQYQTINVLVISRITGTPYAKEKENGINLAFDSFIEDNTKTPAELTPSKYNEEEIKVLLLPDFLKGPLGINDRGVEGVDANEVVADYLNSRLNSYLLRGVERNLVKSLELESLTLEYNFGKDIKNMLPERAASPTVSYQSAPETMYGIGAAKGFLDRFYIDVKYAQAVQESSPINNAYLNYQITYKLSPIVSVVYYREPFSFIEPESDYYKVTLKAGYQL